MYWASLEVVDCLIKCGANPNTRNSQNIPILQTAIGACKYDIVEYLHKNNVVDFNADMAFNRNKALHVAVRDSTPEIVKYLIEEVGANVNEQNVRGDTPLHLALDYDKFEIAKLLIEVYGADKEIKNKAMKTPAETVASYRRKKFEEEIGYLFGIEPKEEPKEEPKKKRKHRSTSEITEEYYSDTLSDTEDDAEVGIKRRVGRKAPMKQPPTSTRIKPRDEETNDVEEVKEVGNQCPTRGDKDNETYRI